jgi:Na+-driven multidrug efflux pump
MTLKAIFLHGTIVIDGYLVSSLGEVALAAMGLAAAIAGLALGSIFAFSGAMQIRTAQAYGTDDPLFAKSTLVSGLTVSLGVGVLCLGLIWGGGPKLIEAFAQSPEIADLAWSYLAVFSLVILGEAIGQCLSSHFNGCGQTRIPLYSFCISVPVNVTASVILIHGHFGFPAFGLVGAAIGSALAIGLQVAFLVGQAIYHNGHLRHVQGWRQGRFLPTLRRHAAFSLPIAMTFISASFAAHTCALIYAKMSLNAFAATTLITPWIQVASQISMQWAQATGIIIAQLLGQEESEAGLDRFLTSAWRGAFVTAGVTAFVFIALGLSVDVLYSALATETRAILLTLLPMLIILPFPKATNAICGNTLRASGDTVYVMNLFLVSQWLFRVPATALAVLYFDFAAVWVLTLLLLEEFVKFGPFHRRLYAGKWKTARFAA